jgi:hypothetical protein
MHWLTDYLIDIEMESKNLMSINLALSERGIAALKHVDEPMIFDQIMSETMALQGRMIHGRDAYGQTYSKPQKYDVSGRASLIALSSNNS